MKGLKFDLQRSAGEAVGLPMYLALRGELSDPGETLLKLRALQSFDRGAARYAIQRTVRCAVRRPLEEVFDDLALHADLLAQRTDSTSLLLDGPGIFISVEGSRKIDYGSCTFHIWAESMNRLEESRAKLLAIVGEQLVRHEMFTIDWQFSSRRGLSSASFDEMADPAPYDEAYPTLAEPVATLIARYLASRETVLILQGPPGTGKTRLVRQCEYGPYGPGRKPSLPGLACKHSRDLGKSQIGYVQILLIRDRQVQERDADAMMNVVLTKDRHPDGSIDDHPRRCSRTAATAS